MVDLIKYNDPLEHFVGKYTFGVELISRIYSGNKYTAVLLKNGNIGVCANFGEKINPDPILYKEPDLSLISHRIVLVAYFNATLNYLNHKEDGDIFELVRFQKYQRIVMLGYFGSLSRKFEKEKINIKIFDPRLKDDSTRLESEKALYLKSADGLILTSTSIFNGTFYDVISAIRDQCDVFMLGPSSIMSNDLFEYDNIKLICGTTFDRFCFRVLDIIQQGGGTRDFMRYENKKVLTRTD